MFINHYRSHDDSVLVTTPAYGDVTLAYSEHSEPSLVKLDTNLLFDIQNL